MVARYAYKWNLSHELAMADINVIIYGGQLKINMYLQIEICYCISTVDGELNLLFVWTWVEQIVLSGACSLKKVDRIIFKNHIFAYLTWFCIIIDIRWPQVLTTKYLHNGLTKSLYIFIHPKLMTFHAFWLLS